MIRRTLAAALIALVAASGGARRLRAGPAPAPARAPEVWAIIVGVDGYADPEIPKCRGAVSDSRAAGRWFVQTARWGREHVLLLNDSGDERPGRLPDAGATLRPTRANLDWAVKSWLPRVVRPRDLVVFYFAGQAIGLPARPDDRPGTRPRDYLLPIDAQATELDRTGWSLDEALDGLASRGENPIACWLDTSPAGRGSGWRSGRVEAGAGLRLLSSLVRWPSVTAWLAAEDRPAPEGGEGGPSPFLRSLVAGLGEPAEPSGLLAALGVLRSDPALARQGFRALGGVPPGLSPWPGAPDPGPAVRELIPQRGHADRVQALAFTADGRWLATAARDSTVRVWRVEDHALFRVLPEAMAGVWALSMSVDGRWIVFGDGLGRIWAWDRIRHRFKPGSGAAPAPGRVDRLGFLPGSRGFVSLDLRAGAVRLWDLSGASMTSRALCDGGAGLVSFASAIDRAHLTSRPAVAFADVEGRVRWFTVEGRPLAPVEGFGPFIEALELSPDGQTLAIGGERGQVWIVEGGTGRRRAAFTVDARITGLRFVGGSALAVGTAEGVRLVGLDGPGRLAPIPLPGGAACLAASPDGRYLAASDGSAGATRLWRLDGEARPADVPLAGAEAGAEPVAATELAFAPDGATLVAGDVAGGLRAWGLPDGSVRFAVPPNRQKVARLDLSPDRRFLLQVAAPDGIAHVWNLERGRGVDLLEGRWAAGAFLPKGGGALAMIAGPDDGGDLVLVDPDGPGSWRVRDVRFPRPNAPGTDRPVATAFDKVAVSADGRRLAAGSVAGSAPIACVWDARTGALVRVVRGEGLGLDLHALAFADGGKTLITAIDRTATAWDVSDAPAGPGADASPIRSKELPGAEDDRGQSAWTALAVAEAPGMGTPRVALGDGSGHVFLWDAPEGGAEGRLVPLPIASPAGAGRLAGAVRALAFADGGRWLVAGGEDKVLRAWSLGPKPEAVRLEPSPHHDERINALAASADAPLFFSGGDDTAVRLWNLKEGTLLGTFSAQAPSPSRHREKEKAKEKARPAEALKWLIFTPDGRYDCSLGGEELARWSFDGSIRALDQFESRDYVAFQLSEDLRQGRRPPLASATTGEPPPLALELKPLRPGSREATLVVSAPAAGVEGLRLYQNGVPVQTADDFARVDLPGRFVARAWLRSGKNRFVVMAGRPDAIDGRSNVVEVDHDGPEPKGRVHVLALGISAYARRGLRYADVDAKSIGSFLERQGFLTYGQQGTSIVLTDEAVTEKRVREAFRTLRDRVKGRPEDTVVLFLAGHTGVFDDRYCLLLSDFPFDKNDPLLVAERGAARPGPVPDSAILPYATLYADLARLEALRRLVIVDACQAESIGRDPAVAQLERLFAEGSRRARTAYLLAAREGEPATEDSKLEHGLLTYVLLRGLGAPGLKALRAEAASALTDVDADLDRDRTVTSTELRRYVERSLPILARYYPSLAQRGSRKAGAPDPGTIRLRADDASFPIVVIEGRAP